MNPQDSHIAFLSVGSNLGDRQANCRRGLELLAADTPTVVKARSECYETSPVGDEDQGWFVNLAVKVETRLAPSALLEALKAVEVKVGRTPSGRLYGPRVLDMDILLYDEMILEGPPLTVPHPRMHEREFVLRPLCDIDPRMQHPVLGKTIQSLLEALNDSRQQVVQLPC